MPTFLCRVAAKTNRSGRKLGPKEHSPSVLGFVLEDGVEYASFHRAKGGDAKRQRHARIIKQTVPATAKLCEEIVAAVKEKYGVAHVKFRQMMDEPEDGAESDKRGAGRPSNAEKAATKRAEAAEEELKELKAKLAAAEGKKS